MIIFLALCPQALLPKHSYAPWKWRFQMVGAVFLLFLGLGAIQILPFWEMVGHSDRHLGFSYQEATRWSLGWRDLLYLFLPDFFWRGMGFYDTDQNYLKSIYLGLIPFLMVLFFFLGRDRRKGWFGLFLVLSLLLALGRNTPFYRVLYTMVPGFHTIRYPAKFLFFGNIFICLLTGLGWDVLSDRLKEDPQKKFSTLKRASLLLAFLFVLILLFLSLFRDPLLSFLEHSFPMSYARPWVLNLHNLERFSFFALLTFIFVIFLADRKISIKWSQAILITLLTLDLFLANWGFYRLIDQKAFYSLSPNLRAVLSDPKKNRIFSDPVMVKAMFPKRMGMEGVADFILKECFYFDFPLIHRIYNSAGFGVMTYQPYYDLLAILYFDKASNPGATDILRLMNVKFLLWHEALQDPSLKLIRKGESYVLLEDLSKKPLSHPPKIKMIVSHLYENKAVLPKAFLVSKYWVVKNGKERMDLLKKKGFDPTQTVLLEEVPDPPPSAKGLAPENDSVRLVKFGLNQMDLDVSCARPRLLFLSETYYPGWKVWVDGKKEKIYRANHAFRAVALSPGRHKIHFRYQPLSVYCGLGISLTTLLGIMLFFYLKRKKLKKDNT